MDIISKLDRAHIPLGTVITDAGTETVAEVYRIWRGRTVMACAIPRFPVFFAAGYAATRLALDLDHASELITSALIAVAVVYVISFVLAWLSSYRIDGLVKALGHEGYVALLPDQFKNMLRAQQNAELDAAVAARAGREADR